MPERKFNVEYWFNKCQGGQAVYILFCNKHLVLLTKAASEYWKGKIGLVASAFFQKLKMRDGNGDHAHRAESPELMCCQEFKYFSDRSRHFLFRVLNYVNFGLAKC